ncbi:MAG: type II toxin-antitoxin system PemK/MazF family toxin [Planctomycetota bacterium]|nr:type II toxin-antitoxin system PemK/MazF family toxin [Planctomycetota bacterium]
MRDVYTVRYRYGRSHDIRPCILLTAPLASKVTICLLSSQMALYRPVAHFLIEESYPDFPATGLDRSSFAAGDEIHEIRVEELRKRLGRLEGELARAFEAWI